MNREIGMPSDHFLKKKPSHFSRQRLLDVAVKMFLKTGQVHLTLEAIAEEAGFSKGGLLHHFPTKTALLEGLCEGLMERLDQIIADEMSEDTKPVGRFTRAYLKALSNSTGHARYAGLICTSLIGEASLRQKWNAWIEKYLEQHDETDSFCNAQVVRLAANGLWLRSMADGPEAEEPLRGCPAPNFSNTGYESNGWVIPPGGWSGGEG